MEHEHRCGLPGCSFGLTVRVRAPFGLRFRLSERAFIGRNDEMIKTSGYRVSPTEVEEALYATKLVGEVAAFGVAHAALGQVIVVIATPPPGAALDSKALLAECRKHLPAYMIPTRIEVRPGPLPRNPNGKIDRKILSAQYAAHHSGLHT